MQSSACKCARRTEEQLRSTVLPPICISWPAYSAQLVCVFHEYSSYRMFFSLLNPEFCIVVTLL